MNKVVGWTGASGTNISLEEAKRKWHRRHTERKNLKSPTKSNKGLENGPGRKFLIYLCVIEIADLLFIDLRRFLERTRSFHRMHDRTHTRLRVAVDCAARLVIVL